jgi:hypothetical protein
MRIVDYKIVQDREASGLEDKIEGFLAQGWKPQGGISTYGYRLNGITGIIPVIYYTQAMIKEEEE